MYIIIVGGGNVGYYLAQTLLKAGHELLLIERDRNRYNFLREQLGESVRHGRGDEMRVLKDAGAGRCEVVVACTGDDEDNLIICQLAKNHFGALRTIARVNDPRNVVVFQRLGVDSTVSSTQIIHQLIEREIALENVIPLAALRNGDVEIIDIELRQPSQILDMPIGDLTLPGDALIISVIHDNRATVPHGDTRLHLGDSVIAIVSKQYEHELYKYFNETFDL